MVAVMLLTKVRPLIWTLPRMGVRNFWNENHGNSASMPSASGRRNCSSVVGAYCRPKYEPPLARRAAAALGMNRANPCRSHGTLNSEPNRDAFT